MQGPLTTPQLLFPGKVRFNRLREDRPWARRSLGTRDRTRRRVGQARRRRCTPSRILALARRELVVGTGGWTRSFPGGGLLTPPCRHTPRGLVRGRAVSQSGVSSDRIGQNDGDESCHSSLVPVPCSGKAYDHGTRARCGQTSPMARTMRTVELARVLASGPSPVCFLLCKKNVLPSPPDAGNRFLLAPGT